MSPILSPLANVAMTPSQHVDVSQLPPSNVTPHVAMAVHMMQRSQINHMVTYMRMMNQNIPIRMRDLHARILHSLLQLIFKKKCQFGSKIAVRKLPRKKRRVGGAPASLCMRSICLALSPRI